MPGLNHSINENTLRTFFLSRFSGFRNSKYECFGRWTNHIDEDIKNKNTCGSIPDIMIISKQDKIIYIGEAKQLKDYKADISSFTFKNSKQLDNYISYLNKKKFNCYEKFLVYSVPTFCVRTTRNEIKKKLITKNAKFDFEVITIT